MQKVYLLLRNNRQTGPHSLEELLQLGLKPFDLIWVEGKSYGWAYPSEIETLRPFVSACSSPKMETTAPGQQASLSNVDKPPSKKIFVSLPVVQGAVPPASPAPDPIEQKADELRQRIQSYPTQSRPQQEEIRTNYARSLNTMEEEYTSWIYRKKIKKKKFISYKYAVAAGIAGIALAATWLMAKTIYKEPAPQTQHLRVQTSNNGQSAAPVAAKKVFTGAADTEPGAGQAVVTPVTRKPKKKMEPPASVQKTGPIKTIPEEVAQKEAAVQPAENTPAVTEEKKEPVATET
ncbi:MAG TPA: hypothetical protein VFS22_08320, partial [Flavisolibacter sp.]|nr:hypothetical protein [Flavisolibacter sp.]